MVTTRASLAGRVKSFLLALVAVIPVVFACSPASNSAPAVTTPEQAITSARQAWKSIHEKASWHAVYSEESTSRFEPYAAVLEDGIWVVRGTIAPGYRGETVESTVRQSDGSVSVKVVVVEKRE